jgi:hypothetical protein
MSDRIRRLGMATIIVPAAMYAAVVANNAIVAAKKVEKAVTGKPQGVILVGSCPTGKIAPDERQLR